MESDRDMTVAEIHSSSRPKSSGHYRVGETLVSVTIKAGHPIIEVIGTKSKAVAELPKNAIDIVKESHNLRMARIERVSRLILAKSSALPREVGDRPPEANRTV